MAIKGINKPRVVDVCAVGCTADNLDQTLKRPQLGKLEHPANLSGSTPYYRIFAQRETFIGGEAQGTTR
ncbi:MAG: hypothetical protein WBD45_10290 [Terriglobales bacterium]